MILRWKFRYFTLGFAKGGVGGRVAMVGGMGARSLHSKYII